MPSAEAHPQARRVFLDAGGGAPVHPVAREAFLAALDEGWADPRRLHAEGRRASLLLSSAREALADALGARTEDVRLTPSLTSALRTAVTLVTRARRRVGSTVVASAVERKALLEAPHDGGLVRVPVDGQGRVDLDRWAEAVSAGDVALAALQHANGEVGTVQPVEAAHAAARDAGVPLLVDAGSSVGHVAVPPTWDLLTADPADWGSVTGVAVAVVRPGVRTASTEEDPWAPGGVSVPAALAAAASLRAVLDERDATATRRAALVGEIRRRVRAEVPDVEVLGPGPEGGGLPHVVAFSCLYVDGEALLTELDRRGVAVGSGSACAAELGHPSHVLAAMGVLTHGNVRLCLPPATTADDVARFCTELADAVAGVRRMLGAEAW